MKKIAILIRTLDMGGIEKSLVNLLNYANRNNYKLDLFVLGKKGDLIKELDSNININVFPGNHEEIIYTQKEASLKGPKIKIKRTVAAFVAKIFSNKLFIKKILKQIPFYDEYDTVIVYQNTPNNRTLYCGPAEIAISKFINSKKIIFFHQDFMSAGINNKYVHKQLEKFDKIVFVSKSCMEDFNKHNLQYIKKSTYVYNIQDIDEIINRSKDKMLQQEEVQFSKEYMNLITVARLSKEKAHLRTLKILKGLYDEGFRFNYHIIGDGIQKDNIKNFIKKNKMDKFVFLYGNQANPYKYIIKSDLFLLLSYHESMGLVIDESYALNIPVLSTNTISAKEFIANENCICDNDELSIKLKLKEIIELYNKNNYIKSDFVRSCLDNKLKFEKFKKIIEQ